MRKSPTASKRSGRVLPDDACISCGTMTEERRGRFNSPINGEPVFVPSVPHLKCPKCGDVMFRIRDAQRMEEDAMDIYRKRHGLLSSDAIRGIRTELDLTQAELADLLHLGANTISRWESGRNVQSAALDILLRLLRDVPGNVAYLRKHAA